MRHNGAIYGPLAARFPAFAYETFRDNPITHEPEQVQAVDYELEVGPMSYKDSDVPVRLWLHGNSITQAQAPLTVSKTTVTREDLMRMKDVDFDEMVVRLAIKGSTA